MNYLKTRIQKLEEKIKGKDGIANWALDEVRMMVKIGSDCFRSSLAANKSLQIHCGEDPKDPKMPELQTGEDINKFAKEISDKFASREEYQAYRQSQIDWGLIYKAVKNLGI